MEDDGARMVRTPWFEEEIEFEQAAEVGTKSNYRACDYWRCPDKRRFYR